MNEMKITVQHIAALSFRSSMHILTLLHSMQKAELAAKPRKKKKCYLLSAITVPPNLFIYGLFFNNAVTILHYSTEYYGK